MRYCPHCGWLTPTIKDICLWCGKAMGDGGQPDADAELDAMDFDCGCGGM